jgi:DNA-binding NtrC family response regulator
LSDRSTAVPGLSPEAQDVLEDYDWPGNVRELENAIERVLHVRRNGVVEPEDLGLPRAHGIANQPPESPSSYKSQKRRILQAFERDYLTRLMTEHGGNVSNAARAAGKERRDLGKLLKRHGLGSRKIVPSK